MSTLQQRIEEVMAAMQWDHADVVRVSRQTSSVVSQWRGKGSKPINEIKKVEGAVLIERATGFSAIWLATGALPKRVAGPWPFEFSRERFDRLSEREKGMVEHAARVELERIEADRGNESAA